MTAIEKPIHVISLGAGVQSSYLLVAADRGEIKVDGQVVIPKYAIFSDPGNEPDEVYEWVKYLQSIVKNIEIIVTNNGNIIDDILSGIDNNERFASVPFFTKTTVPVYEQILVSEEEIILGDYDEWQKEHPDEEGEAFVSYKDGKKIATQIKQTYRNGKKLGTKEEKGILWRQCTGEYKIKGVRKEMRRLYGYGSKEKIRHKFKLWMGISTDEIIRVKPSQVGYIENVFPLIENNNSRQDCSDWFGINGLPLPPSSSCIICPYHSNTHWKRMKYEDPISWFFAVEFDKKIRQLPKLRTQTYLHRSCVPLDEVDFGADQLDFDLFSNECEGMCGV